jgi:pyruvate ferredoxin oxidoreductase beta subunit
MARLAQQTGFFPVFEAEYGEVTHVSKIRRKEPIEKFLMPQKRYAHLFNKKAPQPEIIERLQAIADRNIVKFGLLEGTEPDPVPPSEQGVERALRI